MLKTCDLRKTGKEFRQSLKLPSPNYLKPIQNKPVEAFTLQALKYNSKVISPPKSDTFDPKPLRPTEFRKCYFRGDLPVLIQFVGGYKRLYWTVPMESLDYHYYLPIFLDGLGEGTYPFNFIVEQGVNDLVQKGAHKILPVIPEIIWPLKKALLLKRQAVTCYVLRCIQTMVKGGKNVGKALVPYYGQLLPPLTMFIDRNRGGDNIDDIIDRANTVSEVIEDTLHILEVHGGPDSYINIKYYVPTYESYTQ